MFDRSIAWRSPVVIGQSTDLSYAKRTAYMATTVRFCRRPATTKGVGCVQRMLWCWRDKWAYAGIIPSLTVRVRSGQGMAAICHPGGGGMVLAAGRESCPAWGARPCALTKGGWAEDQRLVLQVPESRPLPLCWSRAAWPGPGAGHRVRPGCGCKG